MSRIITLSVGLLLAIGHTDVVLSETAQRNGVKAAWKACQQCRQSYDTYRVAAATKLAQGDVVAAANTAMDEFYSNMYDGMNIRFTWIGNFVTAEVMKPGSKAPSQRTDLTLSQFNELLVGSVGQYDNVLENSIPVAVQQIAKSNGIRIEQRAPDPPRAQSAIQSPAPRATVARSQTKTLGQFPPQPYQHSQKIELPAAVQTSPPPSQAVRTGQPQAFDVTEVDQVSQPYQFDTNGHYLGAQQPDPGAYSPQLEARSRKIFPDVGREPERQQWMADQEQRAIANDINRSKALLYPVSGR
jgi:hypothetical protein